MVSIFMFDKYFEYFWEIGCGLFSMVGGFLIFFILFDFNYVSVGICLCIV